MRLRLKSGCARRWAHVASGFDRRPLSFSTACFLRTCPSMPAQDYKNIQEGVYKLPWDMTTRGHRQFSPLWVARRSAQAMLYSITTSLSPISHHCHIAAVSGLFGQVLHLFGMALAVTKNVFTPITMCVSCWRCLPTGIVPDNAVSCGTVCDGGERDAEAPGRGEAGGCLAEVPAVPAVLPQHLPLPGALAASARTCLCICSCQDLPSHVPLGLPSTAVSRMCLCRMSRIMHAQRRPH